MRHAKKHGMKLGSSPAHTRAIKKSLVRSLLEHDRIKTTLPRAKAIRGDVEKVITWAKRGDLHARRLAIAAVGDKELVRETFEKAAQGLWGDRDGGYTRIMKLGPRKGDNAEIALIELVTEPVASKVAEAPTKVEKVSRRSRARKAAEAEAAEAATEPAPETEPAAPETPKAPETHAEAAEAKEAPEPEELPKDEAISESEPEAGEDPKAGENA